MFVGHSPRSARRGRLAVGGSSLPNRGHASLRDLRCLAPTAPSSESGQFRANHCPLVDPARSRVHLVGCGLCPPGAYSPASVQPPWPRDLLRAPSAFLGGPGPRRALPGTLPGRGLPASNRFLSVAEAIGAHTEPEATMIISGEGQYSELKAYVPYIARRRMIVLDFQFADKTVPPERCVGSARRPHPPGLVERWCLPPLRGPRRSARRALLAPPWPLRSRSARLLPKLSSRSARRYHAHPASVPPSGFVNRQCILRQRAPSLLPPPPRPASPDPCFCSSPSHCPSCS